MVRTGRTGYNSLVSGSIDGKDKAIYESQWKLKPSQSTLSNLGSNTYNGSEFAESIIQCRHTGKVATLSTQLILTCFPTMILLLLLYNCFLFLSLLPSARSSALTTAIAANERLCFYVDADKAGEKIGVSTNGHVCRARLTSRLKFYFAVCHAVLFRLIYLLSHELGSIWRIVRHRLRR